jgi:SAM-dependent methyltransferase
VRVSVGLDRHPVASGDGTRARGGGRSGGNPRGDGRTGRASLTFHRVLEPAPSDASVDAAIAMMVHTDMPAYPAVLREVARVVRPGGVFAHVGVHPCFCGGFADRSDPEAVVIRPGYGDGHWTTESWTDQGIRDKVGASHLPLAELLNAVLDAGMVPERFAESGGPTPVVLAVRARVPAGGRPG